MLKRIFIHAFMGLIFLVAGVDFVLKTHHIFEAHQHEHDHESCEVCDWALAAFIDVPTENIAFFAITEHISLDVFYQESRFEARVDFILLRGPPTKG